MEIEIERYRNFAGELPPGMDRGTSVTSLLDTAECKETQTDPMISIPAPRVQHRSPQPLPDFKRESSLPASSSFQTAHHQDTFFSQKAAPPLYTGGGNITIINNKHELSLMLEQHKEYELRAMRLQNEIREHRTRLVKEN